MSRIDIRRILYPTDFSDSSGRAFGYALALAAWYEAALTALHVVPTAMLPASDAAYLASATMLEFATHERVQSELSTIVAPCLKLGVPTETVIREGRAAAEIVTMAGELPADLLVMGTHGRTGVQRWVLGSVTETVLRRVRCPVLTVPVRALGEPAPLFYKNFLCATDFSPASAVAVRYAAALAEEAEACLTLVNVLDPEKLRGLRPGPEIDRQRRDYEATALGMLRDSLRDRTGLGFRPEEIVRWGSAAPEILKLAGERNAGLIVMGVHGRGLLDLMAFGSVTHQAVREAVCPVLTVRPRRGEAWRAGTEE